VSARAESGAVISSSKLKTWGGPRENSGGARPNSGGVRVNSGGRRAGAGRKPKPLPIIAAEWTEPKWCVWQSHSQSEGLATHELTRAGYRAYLPLRAVERRDRVLSTMIHKVRVPLFSGYGFVHLAPTDPWAPILHMAGIRGMLLASNGSPGGIVEPEFVEKLIADEAERCDLSFPPMIPLEFGVEVRIEVGAFEGRSGRVRACDGMITEVIMGLFGRGIPVLIKRAALTVA
jgi:transcription antitermination factor NusG